VLGVALAGVALDLFAGGVFIDSTAALIVVVVVSGALLGIVNTVLTEAVMAAAVVERPVASAAYSFVRFTGGAIAPWIAGKLGEHVSAGAPMYLGAGMVALSVVALALSRHHLRHGEPEVEGTAEAVPAGAILVALNGAPSNRLVATAERVARARGAAVHVVHVRETRVIADDATDLEDREAAGAIVDAAVMRLSRAGIAGTGEVLHVTGHHGEAAAAVLDLADRTAPQAVIVGRPTHGEPGAPSLTSVLSERAPCDVVVVARSA
jgi:MFS family permease